MCTELASTPGGRRPESDADADPAACIRRLVEEACNAGRLVILDDLLPAPAPDQRAGAPPTDFGVVADLRRLLNTFRAAVPDARWTIVEQIAQGETVATRLEVRGAFSGPLVGLAPPGRPAVLTGVAISRFAEGQLVGLWLQADLLDLLQQLHVLPQLDLTQALTMAQVARTGGLAVTRPRPASVGLMLPQRRNPRGG